MPAYRDTERGTWFASFHYRDYTGASKRKVKRGFRTKREAQQYEIEFKDHGHKAPVIMYGTLVEEYLEDCRHRLKPTTLVGKTSIQDNYLLPYFKDVKIGEITPLRIRNWQNDMMEDGEFAETTLRRMHAELSATLNFAVKYYGLPKNPCLIAGPMGSSDAPEMKIWSQSQFEEFITHEKKTGYHVAFDILFWTGMRAGELMALTPADIPRDRAVIHVTKGFTVLDGKQMFLTPKTDSSRRDIEIHKQLHEEILAYIDSLVIKDDERLFYFTRPGLLKEFHKKQAEAGLEPIRLHDLRHSHASWLLNQKLPIIVISKRLGHKNPATTLRIYSHLMPGEERLAADHIEKVLSKADDDAENRDTRDTVVIPDFLEKEKNK